jgi:hypothetical protein
MLQRVSLQYWQKLQSGQGFFLRRIIFPIFYFNPKNAFKEKVAEICEKRPLSAPPWQDLRDSGRRTFL